LAHSRGKASSDPMHRETKPHLATSKDLSAASAKRGLYSSKRDNGKIVIVGGSERYHGAPALASNAAYAVLAALRVGIGYVVEYVPRSAVLATRSVSPDLIVMPLSGRNLGTKDVPRLIRDLRLSKCLVLGLGLGRAEDTCKAVIRLIDYIKKSGKMAVIDADALYALGKYRRKLNKNFLVTPNGEELGFFHEKAVRAKATGERREAALRLSRTLNANVLLKGHEVVITDGKTVKLVRSKSSALATMGTGDVLSGIIGAYAANNKMFIAAVAGARLHSIIGDRLHKEMGDHILASDVVDAIPAVLKRFDRKG